MYAVDVDFEKDIVLCEVPFGGVLFINNLVPHRRFVFLCSLLLSQGRGGGGGAIFGWRVTFFSVILGRVI